jgi:hypothetical protein
MTGPETTDWGSVFPFCFDIGEGFDPGPGLTIMCPPIRAAILAAWIDRCW